MRKLVYGVGHYDMTNVKETPHYVRWTSMLMECYSKAWQKKAIYEGCEVCEDWKTFSNFYKWMETQDWEGKVLSKGFLIKGNKFLSPETCCFIPHRINQLFKTWPRSEYMRGVAPRLAKRGGHPFVAQCTIDGQTKYLGAFHSEIGAHRAWAMAALKNAEDQLYLLEPHLRQIAIDRLSFALNEINNGRPINGL